MKKLLAVIFCCITFSLYAQDKPVQFSFTTKTGTAGKYTLVIKATIEKGAKLLSTDSIQGLDDIKTNIIFDSLSKIKLKGKLVAITQPLSEKAAALGDVTIHYFTDSAIWEQEINVAKGDSFRIKGEVLSYVLKGDELPNFSDTFSKEFVYKASEETTSKKSALGWLLAGMAAGLIAFLTPCVYSLVPVTVSLFLKRSESPKHGRRNTLFYSLCIVVIYTIIGAIAPKSILNVISTHWIFNLFVFFLFIIFGISFLGAFQINLPSSWANNADKKSNSTSYPGIFFMALTLVVVSFSCTGAFVASLIASASTASIFGMFGFGFGLALPFTIFAFFPALLKEISKPGGWQNTLKVSLGIIEIALAMKFLSNADVQLHKYWLSRDIYLIIWVGLFAFLTAYLLGVFKKKEHRVKHIPIIRFLFALASLCFTIYLIPGIWGKPLNKISGLLPPYGTQRFIKWGIEPDVNTYKIKPVKYYKELIKNESQPARSAGLQAFFDYDEAMAAAKEQGKPLMIDFTGIVCPNCREFENRVWTMPEVMDRMKNKFVVASLFEDFTQELPDAEKRYSDLLGAQINTVGDKYKELSLKLTGGISQPNYIFLNHDGTKIVEKNYGYDDIQKNGERDFVKHLDEVLEKFNKK